MDTNVNSVMKLDQVVFDKIEFNRQGFKNDNELNLSFNAGIYQSKSKEDNYITTVEISGEKSGEYNFTVSLSGYFSFETENKDKTKIHNMIKNNSVAILVPYIRSQISSLTAQPYTDCVVLPIFNVASLMEDIDIIVKEDYKECKSKGREF